MFDQLDLEVAPKVPKKCKKHVIFTTFKVKNFTMRKDQKRPFIFERHNLIDLMEKVAVFF
jgi:hypothetical protein